MAGYGLLWTIIIGCVAGFLAGKIMKGAGFGLLGDLIVGIIGSWLGGWVFGMLGIAAGGKFGVLVMSVVGACLLLWIVRLFKKG